MTTRTGRWNWYDNHNHGSHSEIDPDGRKGIGMRCERCRNEIWEGDEYGVYFRPKDGKRWLVFCRRDCAELHLDKRHKNQLLTREEYVAQLVHKVIKEKPR